MSAPPVGVSLPASLCGKSDGVEVRRPAGASVRRERDIVVGIGINVNAAPPEELDRLARLIEKARKEGR